MSFTKLSSQEFARRYHMNDPIAVPFYIIVLVTLIASAGIWRATTQRMLASWAVGGASAVTIAYMAFVVMLWKLHSAMSGQFSQFPVFGLTFGLAIILVPLGVVTWVKRRSLIAKLN